MLLIFYLILDLKKNTTSVFSKPLKICNHTHLPQIAIFGSSVSEVGFDCDVIASATQKTVYNFSLNGTRFLQCKGLIDELSATSPNTTTVILCESIFSFKKLDAVNDIERFLPCIFNKNVYQSLYNLQPELTFKCRYVPFYKYIVASNNYYAQSIIGWKNFIKHYNPVDSLNGQVRVYRNWAADQDSIWENAKTIPVVIDSNIVLSYKQTINNLVKNNKKVIITIPPMYMPKGQKIVDITEFRNTLKSLANNISVFYFDFSESMINKKYFYNAHHLNALGATVFSKAFTDSLQFMQIVK